MRHLPLLFLLLFSSCKSPFDPTEQPVGGGEEVSIHYLKTQYSGVPRPVTENWVIHGRVVSSDEYGHFQWTLVLQDETGGIELKVGLSPYFERYPEGMELRVKCAGLVLGAYGGTIQLGGRSDDERYQTGFVDRERLGEHLFATGITEKVAPVSLAVGDFTMRRVNCAVRVEGVQFIEEELGLPWGGTGYTERHVQFLAAMTDTVVVRTAPQMVFGAETLPSGSGSLEGVLTQFAGRYALVLKGPQALSGNRQNNP